MTTITKEVEFMPGITVIRKGTPVDTNGKVANDETAIGIIVEDVNYPNRTATIMTAGTFNVVDGYAHSGIIISGEAAKAMSGIVFTDEDGKEWRFNATTDAENFPGYEGDIVPAPAVADIGKVVGAVADGAGAKLGYVGIDNLPDYSELADGAYTLKCTVSGGSAILSWETETAE